MKSLVDRGVVDPVLFNDTENWVGDCYFETKLRDGPGRPVGRSRVRGRLPRRRRGHARTCRCPASTSSERVRRRLRLGADGVAGQPGRRAPRGTSSRSRRSTPTNARGVEPGDRARCPRLKENAEGAAARADRRVPALRAVLRDPAERAVRGEPPRPRPALVRDRVPAPARGAAGLRDDRRRPREHGARGERDVRLGSRSTAIATDRGDQAPRRWFGGPRRGPAPLRGGRPDARPSSTWRSSRCCRSLWAITLAFFDFSPRRTGTPFLGPRAPTTRSSGSSTSSACSTSRRRRRSRSGSSTRRSR